MNKRVQGYILDVCAKRITREEMQCKLNMTEEDVVDYTVDLLKMCLERKDAELTEYTVILTFIYNEYRDRYVDLYNNLLLCDWHRRHEDIAFELELAKSPTSVDCLYKTVFAEYDYLDYDEFYVLATKCIWGLGEIRTEEAIEKLKTLTSSENTIIKENALYQLERIKEDE